MFRVLGLLILAFALTGCPGNVRPTKPQIVEIPGPTLYVPIDARLTQDCPIEEPKEASPVEAVRVAKARRDALEQCNRDKAAIRAVQGTKVP